MDGTMILNIILLFGILIRDTISILVQLMNTFKWCFAAAIDTDDSNQTYENYSDSETESEELDLQEFMLCDSGESITMQNALTKLKLMDNEDKYTYD